jgi:hypothetical protein
MDMKNTNNKVVYSYQYSDEIFWNSAPTHLRVQHADPKKVCHLDRWKLFMNSLPQTNIGLSERVYL